MATDEVLARAVDAHRSGALAKAEKLYRQVLAATPEHVDALHNLGQILLQDGKAGIAANFFRRAIAAQDDCYFAHSSLGNALAAQQRLTEAEAAYRTALRHKPDFTLAHANLGLVLMQGGRPAEAADAYRACVALDPNYCKAQVNLGAALEELGDFTGALAAYRRAVEIDPRHGLALRNLAEVLARLGHDDDAVATFRTAVGHAPDDAALATGFGALLTDLGRLADAVTVLRHAVATAPDDTAAARALARALLDKGALAEAAAALRYALGRKKEPETALALALVLGQLGDGAGAMAVLEAAARYRPASAEIALQLGILLHRARKLEPSLAAFRRALALDPDHADAAARLTHGLLHACDWRDYLENAATVLAAIRQGRFVAPLIALGLDTSAADQLACAQAEIRRLRRPRIAPFSHPRPVASRKIRLGYLSTDFHQHPVAELTAGLFEAHDRADFEVTGYSLGADDGGPLRQRLMRGVDRFVDLRPLSDADAARRIHADGVDILVDLTGHTGTGRATIPACRPAPIQVNYLGFAGTMGAPFMDYVLADRFLVPSDQQPFFAEALVHLPNSYMVTDDQREIAAATPSRAACGLPDTGFVFCSFNNTFKILPPVFAVWMRLLGAVPGSVLWLAGTSALAADTLRRHAHAHGIAPERLVFADRVPSMADHLARYRQADLFLDTLPYNAHSTACDALWAGLPVLTCAGHTFAARVAGSLLTAAGLPDLVTTSLDDYETLALRLATDRARLDRARATLAATRATGPLFDTNRFTRGLEQAYRHMWDRWRAGLPPEAFAVPGQD